MLGELRGDGVPAELLERIDVPAGIDIGARTPAEIALSILAEVVAVRRQPADCREDRRRPDLRHDGRGGARHTLGCGTSGETVYFCCEGCKAQFELAHQHAGAD